MKCSLLVVVVDDDEDDVLLFRRDCYVYDTAFISLFFHFTPFAGRIEIFLCSMPSGSICLLCFPTVPSREKEDGKSKFFPSSDCS